MHAPIKENTIEKLFAELDYLITVKTPQELAKLEEQYKQRLSVLPARFAHPPPKTNTALMQMEFCILRCLHLYTRYRQMELEPPEEKDAAAVDAWLETLDNAERKLHWGAPDQLEIYLPLHKLKVFLLAIKLHILVLAHRTPTVLRSAFLHFACEMHNYINLGNHGRRALQITGRPNPQFLKQIMEPINLFSTQSSAWNECTARAVNAALPALSNDEAVDTKASSSKAGPKTAMPFKKFAEYMMQCFRNLGSFNPDFLPNENTNFLIKLGQEIPRVLLAQTNQVEVSLETNALNYAKILFMQIQLLGIILTNPEGIETQPLLALYYSLQKRLEDKLLLLCLYRYLLKNNFLFRFVDVDITLNRQESKPTLESIENQDCLNFFKHLADSRCDIETLLEFAQMPQSNNTQRLLIYFLIGASKDREACLQALEKIKSSKTNTHPTIIMGLSALDELFNPESTADEKTRAVGNYFIEFKRLPAPKQKTFTYLATFFLICQIGLAMENTELSKMIREDLSRQTAKTTQTPQKSVDELAQEIEGPPKNVEKKKKKKKKNKKNGKKNTAPEKQAVDVLFIEDEPINPGNIEPVFVAHEFTREFTPAMPRSLFARKVKIINTEESEQTYPQNIEEVSVLSVTTHEPTPAVPAAVAPRHETRLDFCGYLAIMQQRYPEAISQITRAPFFPISAIEDRFNALATVENNGKYAMFSFGEINTRNPDHINLIANCSMTETQELLKVLQLEFQNTGLIMHIDLIPSAHPHFLITFENWPKFVPIKISTFENATQKPLSVLVQETQKTLGFLPLSIFRLSFRDKTFVIDFNQALKLEKEKPGELYLISETHDEKTAMVNILLGIEFLARHPEFTASQKLVDWMNANKYCLQNPQAIHPVVKLLFSGVASRGLLIMKQLDLLGGFFEPLEKLVEDPGFMAWVQNFDLYYSFGCKLSARVNYPSVFIDVLARFFFPVGALPPHVDYASQIAVSDRWSFWRSQQQHPQPQEATQQQQPLSPRLPEKK